MNHVLIPLSRRDYFSGLLNDGYFMDPATWSIRSPAEVRAYAAEDRDRRARKSYRDFQNLRDATIAAGSSDIAKDWVWLPDEFDGFSWESLAVFEKTLARFAGWSICFREADIPADPENLLALTGLVLKFDTPSPVENHSPSEIAEQIVRLHREGVTVVRDVIKKELAQGMKAEQWRATWRMAAEQCPELSKRGPKRSRKSL